MELQLVVDNTREPDPRVQVIAYYEALIAARETALLEDLRYYIGMIADLELLDPTDASGLMSIYQAHERHIRRLLVLLRS